MSKLKQIHILQTKSMEKRLKLLEDMNHPLKMSWLWVDTSDVFVRQRNLFVKISEK